MTKRIPIWLSEEDLSELVGAMDIWTQRTDQKESELYDYLWDLYQEARIADTE